MEGKRAPVQIALSELLNLPCLALSPPLEVLV